MSGSWYEILTTDDVINIYYRTTASAARAIRAPDNALQFLHQHLLPYLPPDHPAIECWTEYTRYDRQDPTLKYLFRTCSNFRRTGNWFDWALADWGGNEDKIPTHLLAFVDLKHLPEDFNLDISGYTINGPGIHAVVERFVAAAPEEWTWPSSLIDLDIVTNMLLHGTILTGDTGLSQLFLIDMESIVDVCAVVPNLQPNLNQPIVGQPQSKRTKNYKPLGGWFMIRPRSIWGQDFLDFIKEEYQTKPRWLQEETEEEEEEPTLLEKKRKSNGR